jgi:hypothetical protein
MFNKQLNFIWFVYHWIMLYIVYVLHVFAKEGYCDVSSGLFHQIIAFTLTKV